MPDSVLSLSSVSTAHVAKSTGKCRPMWRQVCLAARIELTPGVSAALRELLAPVGSEHGAVMPGDLERARGVMGACGFVRANAWAAAQGPVRLEPGQGDGNLALVVDAVASDVQVVSSWRPQLPPEGSRVLSRSGFTGSASFAGLLELCTRWSERLVAACQHAAAQPYEVRVLAWPMTPPAAGHAPIVERYLAGGPDAAGYSRAMAAERQAQISQARQLARPGAFARGTAGQQALHLYLAHRADEHISHGLPAVLMHAGADDEACLDERQVA